MTQMPLVSVSSTAPRTFIVFIHLDVKGTSSSDRLPLSFVAAEAKNVALGNNDDLDAFVEAPCVEAFLFRCNKDFSVALPDSDAVVRVFMPDDNLVGGGS